MSEHEPDNFRADRRRWLRTSATVLGGALLPSYSIHTAKHPIFPDTKEPISETKPTTHFFTPAEHRTVEELSETIIPADPHSGGAKAAGVADFIDHILKETTDDGRKALWKEGLALLNLMSEHRCGKSVAECAPSERIAILTILSENEAMTDLPEIRMFIDLKQLTVRGYYTSKVGIHEELEYKGNRILPDFVGCDEHDNKLNGRR